MLTVKEDLMVSLMENESKISLALDCWLSKNGYAFLGKFAIVNPHATPLLFLYCNVTTV